MYEPLRRSSLGHRLQAELNHNQQRYNQHKTSLQRSFQVLCLDSHGLYTSPAQTNHITTQSLGLRLKPCSPLHLSKQSQQIALQKPKKARNTEFLPPIHNMKVKMSVENSGDMGNTTRRPLEEASAKPKLAMLSKKNRDEIKNIQKAKGRKKPQSKPFVDHIMTLPNIHSPRNMPSQWDSSGHHKDDTDPTLKRSALPKIRRKSEDTLTKLKFTTQPPRSEGTPRPAVIPLNNSTATAPNSLAPVFIDHFPRLPSLRSADSSTTEEEEQSTWSFLSQDEEKQEKTEDVEEEDKNKLPSTPLNSFLQSVTSKRTFLHGIERRIAEITSISLETLQMKGEYSACTDAYRKRLMLWEIMCMVHQRMHNNELELRLFGVRNVKNGPDNNEGSDIPQSNENDWTAVDSNKVIRVNKMKKGKQQSPKTAKSKLRLYFHQLSTTRKVAHRQEG